MMLGRTANGLFWMFRYLERAENTARLLDAGFRMALTRDFESAEDEWRSVLDSLGLSHSYQQVHGTFTGIQAWNFVLRDKANTNSVREMWRTVRSNARHVRNAISGELWTAVNEVWLELDDVLARPVSAGNLGDVIQSIRRGGSLAHGAMAGSMLRNEGYHFAQAGSLLERADSTARILDIKYFLLLPSLSYVGSTLDSGQWDTVLRSVGGDRAYRWLNAGNIDARGIVEFLVLDDSFPRSLAFCHSELRDHLAELARMHGSEGTCNALMRQADMDRAELTIEDIFEQGLHEYILNFIADNAAIGRALAEDYRFLA